VRSLAIVGGDVYVGGMFNQAGTTSAGNIVRWHAATDTFHALGSGVGGLDVTGLDDAPVSALDVAGNTLVVGGYFTVAGNSGARFVARFDTLTETWLAVGSGVLYGVDRNTAVYAVTAQPDSLYLGGLFDKAGGIASVGFARWSPPQQADVVPAAGGLITEDDGVALQFPAGALPADSMAYYRPRFAPSSPLPEDALVLHSFVFTAMAQGKPVGTATQPYSVRLPYTDAQLTALGIEDPSTLDVVTWDGAAWVSLGGKVDTTNRVVTISTSGFGEFVLVGQKAAPTQGVQLYLPAVQR
jgi:hypothetical protein